MLAFSFLAYAAFFLIESRVAEPIIHPGLFRNRIFSVSVVATFLVSVGMYGAIMYLPLFVQGVLGESATNSGAVLTPMMLGFMASSVVGGWIMARTGRYKALALIGFAVAAVGMFMLSRLGVDAPAALVIRDMIVAGLGIGISMSLFTVVVQNAFPFRQLGQVTASLQFFRSIGGTIGVAVLGTVMTNGFQSAFNANTPATLTRALPPDRLAALQNPQVLLSPEATAQIQKGFSALGPRGQVLFEQLINAIQASLATAITNLFLVSAALMAAALVACLFLQEIPLRKSFDEGLAEDAAADRASTDALVAARPHLIRLARGVVLGLAAIGLVALLGFPRGRIVAQVAWPGNALPSATLALVRDGSAVPATSPTNPPAPSIQPAPAPSVDQPADRPAASVAPVAAPARRGVNTARATAPAPSPPPASVTTASERQYTVRAGDTLSTVAARFYGDSNAWPRIAAANGGRLPNPNVLQPGQILLIPN